MTEIRLCGERNSDVVSFHSYGNLNEVRERLDELQRYGRPLLCTEWLARHHGSKFASHLPRGHDRAAQPGETLGESIYETADRYGPHKLIAVTVNHAEFAAFGTHPDNEEFPLIGNPDSQPICLAVALYLHPTACQPPTCW